MSQQSPIPAPRVADKLRDERLADRDAANRELAAAQAKAQDAECAERELRRRQVELAAQARVQYRDDMYAEGGVFKRRNALAEQFDAAVAEGDGAKVLTAWLAWRIEIARSAGAIAEYDASQYGATYGPADFARDLNHAITKHEADAKADGAREVLRYVDAYVDQALS